MGKGVAATIMPQVVPQKARLGFAIIAVAFLTMDASSFAVPEPTMDKMTFLVDKLTCAECDECPAFAGNLRRRRRVTSE
jgi:hypothetical protein